jgi:drug/metabolite transporter (DMT)-like permease
VAGDDAQAADAASGAQMERGRAAHVSPYLLLTLTSLFWAGNWVIGRGLQAYMSPIAMAFWRWLGALVLVLPFVVRPLVAQRALIARHWKILTVLAVLSVAMFNTFTYTGLRYTTATTGVLLNSVTPVLILAAATLFLKEPVSARQAGGVALSLAGVVLIVVQGEWMRLAHLTLNPGDIWVLAAVTAWAIYTVCLRWRPRGLSTAAFTGVLIAIGLLAIAPAFAWDYVNGARTVWNARTVAAVAYFALFPSVLAYYFWNAAVARVGGNRAGVFLHLIPLFGTVLSIVFLGERLAWYHYVGAALIFGGVYAASRARMRLRSA